MSEKRRHSSGGGVKKFAVWGGWILAIGLAAHLAYAHFHADEQGTPQGVITPEIVQGAAFWTPIGASVLLSILSLYWSSKAYAQTERTSLIWARRGYVFSLVGAVVLSMAVFDAEMFPRPWLAALASILFGVQTAIFAMVAFKEHRRAETGEGSRRARPSRSSSSSTGESAAAPDSAQ